MSSQLMTLLSLAFAGGSITKLHNAAAQRGADPVPIGKLWRVVRTGRAAVLAALLLGLPLAGWAAAAQVHSTGSASSTPKPRPDPGRVWLQIMAFAEAPVVGADVRVSAHGHLLVEAKAATNQYGAFSAAVPRHLSFFRVTISGGTINGNPFLGHLMADVVLTEPAHQFEIVVVNPVTTLVSLVLDRRRDFNIPDREPKLELDDAQALVRRFLKLPANYDLGMALRQSSHYKSRFFSPVALMTEVRDAGGLDAFLHLLLQELASGSTHPFRQPQLLGSTTSTATADVQTGLEAAALDYAGANNVANLTGWAMALGGSTTSASSDDIDALVTELADLTSAIANLSSQIADLSQQVASSATYTQFTNESGAATNPWGNDIQGLQAGLSSYASTCPPLAAGSTSTPDPSCPSIASDLKDQLQQEYDNNWYEQVQSEVQDNSSKQTKGMIHLYSLFLGQSKPFFRPADSTTMQNLYDYWDSILTAGANVRMEYFHVQKYQNDPAGQQLIISFMGNTDPIISYFSATSGSPSTLSWKVTDSTSVSIDNGVGSVAASGTHSVSPSATTTYTLTATNGIGSTTAKVTVGVSGSTSGSTPAITSFSANLASVASGTAALLSWTITGSTSQMIDQGVGSVAASGTQSVSPLVSTTYTLTATNCPLTATDCAGAATATASVTISVPPVSSSTTGAFQANETANQKLMFPPLPAPTDSYGVVVSTVDHTMWALLPWQPVGGSGACPPNASYCNLNIATGCWLLEFPGLGPTVQGYAGFSDWNESPYQSVWQAALKLAPALSSGTSWMNWLIAQTQTTGDESPASKGFYNMDGCAGGPYGAWTSTNNGGSNYWVIRPDEDQFLSQPVNNSNYRNFIWPARTLKSGEQYYWYQ